MAERYDVMMNATAPATDPNYPIVATTHRLTEHYLSGPMSRFDSWLNELQPEMFIEISPELAAEKGIEHGGWAVVWTARAAIETRVMVTKRVRPLTVDGRTLHQIGLPFHWGYAGETVGAVANDLIAIALDPNVSIQESKAFACNLRAGRLTNIHRDNPLDAEAWPTRDPAPNTPASAQPEGQSI